MDPSSVSDPDSCAHGNLDSLSDCDEDTVRSVIRCEHCNAFTRSYGLRYRHADATADCYSDIHAAAHIHCNADLNKYCHSNTHSHIHSGAFQHP